MYTNADCYLNEMSEIKLLLSTLTVKPHVIAITEVKYKNNRSFSVSELSLDGFDLYSNDLEKNQRGVLIYVNSSLCSSLVNIDTNFNENLFIRINDEIIIGNIYRSPSSKAENDEELCKLIHYISKEYTHLILVGNFNFSDIHWDS